MVARMSALLAVILAVFLVGCGGEDVVEPEELIPPSNLRVTAYPIQGGTLELAWDPASGDFVGYRVYAHTSSLQNTDDPQVLATYQVDDVVGATQTTISLPSDQYHYVHVRAYRQNNDLSRASNELYVIARPQGAGAVVYEFASAAGNPSGFDFSRGEPVSMATANPDRFDRVDFFVGYQGGTTGGGDLYLWSPKKAGAQYQNATGFASAQNTTFEGLTNASGYTFSDNVKVTVGSVIAVRITDENAVTNYAKMEITAVGGTAPNRTVTFRWAYQPAPNSPVLVPGP